MNGMLIWRDYWAFLLLVMVPTLIVLTLRERRRTPALFFPLTGILQFCPRGLAKIWWLPSALRITAVTLAIMALCRPQILGAKGRDLSVEGIDIVVALDVSTSMNAVDFRPRDRISVSKEVLTQFIDQRINDRIGLVVFAGEAYTQAPLTLDHRVLTEILGSVETGLVEDGTAIGNALGTAINRICQIPSIADGEKNSLHCQGGAKTKVIILITDGDNNKGNISPIQAASMAKELGIRIFPIMVGKGGLVPFPAGRDFFGQPVFQQVEVPVNPKLLQSIANNTDGSFYNAVDRESLKKGLSEILNQLEKTKLSSGTFDNFTEVFSPFLLSAFLLLLLEIVLNNTKLRSFP